MLQYLKSFTFEDTLKPNNSFRTVCTNTTYFILKAQSNASFFFSFVELKLILGFGSARRHLAYRENY